jgi:hypothetical protein
MRLAHRVDAGYARAKSVSRQYLPSTAQRHPSAASASTLLVPTEIETGQPK